MACKGVKGIFKVLVHLLDLQLVEIRGRCVLSTSFRLFGGVLSQRQRVGSTNGCISVLEYGF